MAVQKSVLCFHYLYEAEHLIGALVGALLLLVGHFMVGFEIFTPSQNISHAMVSQSLMSTDSLNISKNTALMVNFKQQIFCVRQ